VLAYIPECFYLFFVPAKMNMKTLIKDTQEIDTKFILNQVKAIGDTFLQNFRKSVIPNDEAGYKAQFKAIDEQCLLYLKTHINARYPDIPWAEDDELAIQTQNKALNLPEYWICDAIDGAAQYMQHLPGWTVNLLLVRNQRPYFAVIYDPLHQELYWAKEGVGAYLNDEPIKIAHKQDFRLMLAAFNHPPFHNQVTGLNNRIGNSTEQLLTTFGAVRNYGPTGLQIASVGAGRIDVFCQEGMDTYNWLAGILIAREAGAEISSTSGSAWQWGDDSLFVAAPGIIANVINRKY
jgi:myo-inositol-1(or 4)-monophosphatase